MGLDTVEIVMALEEAFGIEISDAEAETLGTPRQTIEFIISKIGVGDESSRICLTQRAFHHLRHSLVTEAGVPRARIRPNALMRELIPADRRRTWHAVRSTCQITSLPGLGWFSPRTVGDWARWATVNATKALRLPGEPWTRSEIRTIVRAIITDATSVNKFDDDDHIIHDIGAN